MLCFVLHFSVAFPPFTVQNLHDKLAVLFLLSLGFIDLLKFSRNEKVKAKSEIFCMPSVHYGG